MKTLFGTDGMRGIAGQYPLDAATVYELGRALVGRLRREGLRPEILVGRDTRESGAWIEAAFLRGIEDAAGVGHSAGIIPTSGVAYLTKVNDFSAGAVISASHNPYRDNGIKIFSHQGFKIPDDWEEELEASLRERGGSAAAAAARPGAGRPAEKSLIDQYERFLSERPAGLKRAAPFTIVLDCANGAASLIAPEVFRAAGCRVTAIHAEPDGRNINAGCGALHPESLAAAVVREKADLGVAYDGDADRAMWADADGRLLNGDHTLFGLARFMAGRGRLKGGAVVATTMSNLGLEKALGGLGLPLVRTRVGDKYVLEKMLDLGANLGGERSGHTILLDDCPTGDGILTSLRVLEAMAATGGSLADFVAGLAEFPQVLLNVRVASKPDLNGIPEVAAALDDVGRTIAGRGRLDVRYSGTEPLARVMLEGEDQAEVEALAGRIAAAIDRAIGVRS
ncbi:MAG: phosphoglucosamine mutase [Acidobacteriota bacterium]|nr:phosphoglucosamine mutase [Acidobacteriota bacterium]